jgi:hypothetical protein
MSDEGSIVEDREDIKRYSLHLEILREHVKEQSGHFDAIDSKVGVSLGFAFIAIGQVVTAVYRADPRTFHEGCISTFLFWLFFCGLIFCFAFAVVAGAISRHPKFFNEAIELDAEDWTKDQAAILKSVIERFNEVVKGNDESLNSKSSWATAAYIAVTLAIGFSLGLLVTLFSAIFRLPV